ncbi:MAG TPA: PIN domain-containing protein [Thermomicrobiales bacterium]|nr:PIN domain-containing protein [Thermomicrobiales bacterium]
MGAFRIVVSEHLLGELISTLDKPCFTRNAPAGQRMRFLALIRDYAEETPLTISVSGTSTHPEDDLVLATAVSAGVDYLVTGDRQLLALGHIGDVSIVSPREFAAALDSEDPGGTG